MKRHMSKRFVRQGLAVLCTVALLSQGVTGSVLAHAEDNSGWELGDNTWEIDGYHSLAEVADDIKKGFAYGDEEVLKKLGDEGLLFDIILSDRYGNVEICDIDIQEPKNWDNEPYLIYRFDYGAGGEISNVRASFIYNPQVATQLKKDLSKGEYYGDLKTQPHIFYPETSKMWEYRQGHFAFGKTLLQFSTDPSGALCNLTVPMNDQYLGIIGDLFETAKYSVEKTYAEDLVEAIIPVSIGEIRAKGSDAVLEAREAYFQEHSQPDEEERVTVWIFLIISLAANVVLLLGVIFTVITRRKKKIPTPTE